MLPFLATSVSGSFGSNTGFPTLSTLQNYMIKIWPRVQVTAVSGFIEQKSKHNYYCLPTSSQSIKLQRASRDTSLLANRIPVHIAGYLSGSEPDNTLQIEARWNCESRGLMDDNCVWIILFMCSMNPETAVSCTRGHFNHVVFVVYPASQPKLHSSPI